MVRRIVSNAAIIAAALLPLGLIACGGDDNNGGTGGTGGSGGTGGTGGAAGSAKDGGASDAATSDSTTTDSGGGDVTVDKMPDTGPTLPDGSVPPSGMQIATGNVTVSGVTSDNYVVYSDNDKGTLNVIPIAGGMPTQIGAADDRVAIKGTVVVSWVGTARVSAMSIWTKAHGAKSLSMSSYANTTAVAVSADGEHILYFDGVDAGRNGGNLFISGTDGTGQKQLVESVALRNTACPPALAFGGSSAAAAAYCIYASPPDAGTTDAGTTDAGTTDAGTTDAGTIDVLVDARPQDGASDTGTSDGANPDGAVPPAATVQSYSGASWTATTIASNVDSKVAVSPNGATVLVSAPAGLLAYPIAGGAATTIDAAGGFGVFTSDGLSVIYTTPANALKRSTVASPSPTTLAASGIAGFRTKSPDDKWVLGYSVIDATQDLSDLYLASATTPGTPTTLTMSQTAGLFSSDGFTADSSHAIYYTDIASGVGNFFTIATSGGMPVQLGTNVWLHYAGTGSKVVFNDNYDGNVGVNGVADIRMADTAQAGAPKLLVSLADADFFIAGSKDKVVYAWSYLGNSMSGLWVTPIP